MKYHFVREIQNKEQVEILHSPTEDQLADIFTKSLPPARFEMLREKIGVCSYFAKRGVEASRIAPRFLVVKVVDSSCILCKWESSSSS